MQAINVKQVKALTKCASTDTTRPSLNAVAYFHATPFDERPGLVATDGHRLAIMPLEGKEEATDGALIPRELLANAAPFVARGENAQIAINGNVSLSTKAGVVTSELSDTGPYPDYRMVWPKGELVPMARVSFNARYLYELALALGAGNDFVERVTLEFTGAGKAIIVTAANGKGLLMPLRDKD